MPMVDDPRHPLWKLAAEDYLRAEESLAASGVPFVILRNAPYSELHVIERFIPAIAAGTMRINTGDGRAGFISRRDVARAAMAATMADGDNCEGRIYDTSGPELLSFRQVAGLLSEVSGHEVEYVELDDQAFWEELRAAGVDELTADALTAMGRAVREGYFAVQADAVHELTAQAPLSLRSVLESRRDELVKAGEPR
jgi:NAD(P)H dehydrogenase (quinone)